MKRNCISLLLGLVTILAIVSCAASPEERATKLASTKGAGWSVPTEEEVAKALDGNKDMQAAAKDLVKLKKDKELMFCKRYKEIGSNLPTITCLTTAQLRERVENMNKYRDDMRNKSGKCTLGAGSGGGPCSAGQ
jgi:hypothetical protein